MPIFLDFGIRGMFEVVSHNFSTIDTYVTTTRDTLTTKTANFGYSCSNASEVNMTKCLKNAPYPSTSIMLRKKVICDHIRKMSEITCFEDVIISTLSHVQSYPHFLSAPLHVSLIFGMIHENAC